MKSYFADTVQSAFEQARRELGPEAAMVTSRVSSADARHLGQYEVVFASDLPPGPPSPAGAAPARSRAAAATGMEELTAQIGMVRREVEMWRQTALDAMEQPRWMLGEPELQRAFARLLESDVDRDLAIELLSTARKAALTGGLDLRGAIADQIRRAARIDADAAGRLAAGSAVALVGPPGAGKTAVAAKLAIRYGVAERRPVTLIAYDGERVAASEELRWYASILGAPFLSVDNNLALGQALDERRGRGLVLIDTPGFTARDLAAGCEQADYLARREDVETHLVLPLSMRAPDLARTAAAFAAFRPARLIFTRLDETEARGPVLSEAARSGLAVSFFSTGQRVPEDLEPATEDALFERLLPPAAESRKALSAA